MVSHKIVNKLIIIGSLIFLIVNSSSLGLTQDKSQGSSLQEPTPYVFGQLGENQWFVSAVTITFEYDPVRVKEIQYQLDDIWHKYTGPFNVADDGVYMVPWFWIDMENEKHNGGPIEFKIDKTPPTIKLTKKSGGKETVIFTAEATDEVSKIERVEFYLDGVLQQTDTEIPYQYSWTGTEKQIVYAIGYNFAGLTVKSDNLTTTPKPHLRNHNFMNIIIILLQKIFIRFY